jgi:hypothetical protein
MKAVIFFMAILTASDLSAEARSAKVEAAPSPEAVVAVRTYNYAAVPFGQLASAKSEAGQIFRRAGISVEWIDCRVRSGDDGAGCTEPLRTGRDLMLRLVDHLPTEGERIIALGESILDREQRGGVLMTIDVCPVRSVAERAFTSISALLGRAVAHEIGHLLLGSSEHPRLGLMRALWSHDELRGLKPAHWGFSAREAARMRQTLRGIARTAD